MKESEAEPPIATVEAPAVGRLKIRTSLLRAYTMVIALVALWLIFNYMTDGTFLTPRNLSNLVRQTAVTGILAVGMLMVIVSGNIDLSVGSLVGLTGGLVAISQAWLGFGFLPSLAIGLAVGLAIGAFHGGLVAYANIPAFIVTLGGLQAWRGVIKGASKGNTIPIDIPAFRSIGQDYVNPTMSLVLAGVELTQGAVGRARIAEPSLVRDVLVAHSKPPFAMFVTRARAGRRG